MLWRLTNRRIIIIIIIIKPNNMSTNGRVKQVTCQLVYTCQLFDISNN